MAMITVILAITAALGIWCLLRTRREYRHDEKRSALSALLVWAVYMGHLAATVAAAALGIWPMNLPPVFAVGAGLLLIIIGATLFWAGVWSFRSFQRVSGMDSGKLVTTGIYQWSRNPQNVGWSVFLVGIALLGGSWLALILAALFLALFVVYVQMEERHLESVFGEDYRRYRRWSHRYFGRPDKAIRQSS